jgi:hypothetical protein
VKRIEKICFLAPRGILGRPILFFAFICVIQNVLDGMMCFCITFSQSNFPMQKWKYLPTEKQTVAICALCEGNSIRSIERMTGIHRDTVTQAVTLPS